MNILLVKVKFYNDRKRPFPLRCYSYRPHFVVDGDTEMLGVEFLESNVAEFDKFGEAIVKLLYDNVGYYKLAKGVGFKIVEGGFKVVGEGCVIENDIGDNKKTTI